MCKTNNIKKKIVKKLNEHPEINIELDQNERKRDVLLFSTKNNDIYICDLKNNKLIYEFNPQSENPRSMIKSVLPYKLALISKDIYLEVILKNSWSKKGLQLAHNIQKNKTTIFDATYFKLESLTKKNYLHDPYFLVKEFGWSAPMKITIPNQYKLEIKDSSFKKNTIKITHKNPNAESVNIEIEHINSICVSPKKTGPYLLVCYYENKQYCLKLFNNKTTENNKRDRT